MKERNIRFPIRTTAFVLFSFTSLLLILVVGLSIHYLIRRGFASVEMEDLKKDIMRIRHAVEEEVEKIDIIAYDWAAWDPTYRFITDANQDYIDENVDAKVLSTQRIDLIFYIDLDKNLVYKTFSEKVPREYREHLEEELLRSPLLLLDLNSNPEGGAGMLSHGDLPIMISARPIIDSSHLLPPRGHLIIGRLLTEDERNLIAQKTELDLIFLTVPEYRLIHPSLTTFAPQGRVPYFSYSIGEEDTIEGYFPAARLSGETAFWIQTRKSRDLYRLGQRLINFILGIFIASSLLFSTFYFLIIDRKVLIRILRLNRQVLQISTKQGKEFVSLDGKDELTTLGSSINAMLRSLRNSREALEESERLNRTLAFAVLKSPLATVLLNRNFRISQANDAFLALIEEEHHAIRGETLTQFYPSLSEAANNDISESYKADASWEGELEMQTKRGTVLWTRLSLSPIFDEKHEITFHVGIIHDISLQKGREAKAQFEASHDYLTGLPNRSSFFRELDHLKSLELEPLPCYALFYTDLDKFKPINDEYGHTEGDRVLTAVAQRFGQTVRDHDRLARVGGDEFCFLFRMENVPADALLIAQRLLHTISQPIHTQTAAHHIGISIGIAFFPHDTGDPHRLYELADEAMYRAKRAGKNRFILFNPEWAIP